MGWKRIRRTVSYRILYVLVLAFGGVGILYVLLPGAAIGYYWAPAYSVGAAAFFAIAIAALGAYLCFLILLPPVRREVQDE